MMSNLERLIYMANQIARNFEAEGEAAAVAATANHIQQFWDPRMKAQAVACLDHPESGLGPVATRAIASLRANAQTC
jgi:formate dehydrogenase subunit delta